MRSIDHSGRHGPKPPKRRTGSSFHRHNPSSSRRTVDALRPDRNEVAQPLDGQAWVHALPPLRELVDGAGPALLHRGLGVVIEPSPQLARHQAAPLVVGNVGPVPPRGQAVEVDEVRAPVRQCVSQLHQDAAALGMADERDRSPGRAVEHGERVTHVGVPAVQHRVLGVAVAALVPAHDAPSRIGEQRSEHVVGAGEVEPAVRQEQRWRVLRSPLPHRETQSVIRHPAMPRRTLRAGEGNDLIVVGHGPLSRGERVRSEPGVPAVS